MNKSIVKNLSASSGFLSVALTLISGAMAADNTKPIYRILVGEKFAVCKAYLRNLKAFGPNERDPVCDPRPHTTRQEFLEPEWEAMDVWQNIELVYKAEMSWGIYRNHPEKHPTYEQWHKDFEAQAKSGAIQSSLKRARIEFVQGHPVTVIAYSRNPTSCEADFARDGASENAGHRWFFYDGDKRLLKRDEASYGSDLAGAILLFRKRPIFVNTVVTANEIYLWENPRQHPIYSPTIRCRFDVDDPAKPSSMLKQRPFTK